MGVEVILSVPVNLALRRATAMRHLKTSHFFGFIQQVPSILTEVIGKAKAGYCST
jgi:hypothetical protein